MKATQTMERLMEASGGVETYPFVEQLRFERLLSEMATSFVNLPISRFDREIQETLRRISEFFKVDRSTVFELAKQPHTLEVVYTHTTEGVDPADGLNVGERFPWCWQKLLRGERIVISSLKNLPAEAVTDLENLRRIGIRSFIGLPIRIKGHFRFVLTLTSLRHKREWHHDLLNRIHLVGQLLGNALHRKETEKQLAKIAAESHQFQSELSHRDRIGTISALTAAIAHEINQPLAAILSNTQAALQMLSRNPPDLEEIRQILLDIVTDDKRASEIIYNVRNLLKKSERYNVRFGMNEVVTHAVRMIQSEAVLRSIVIIKDLSPGLPPVFGDPILIQQVLLNLLINAMDAIHDNGENAGAITVMTRPAEAGWIVAHVCDSGPGTDESVQDAIFRKPYTSKQDGLGIGLILCRSIIEAHAGILSTENLPEGGARFSIRLPAQDS